MSNRERAAIKDELITELVAGCQNEADLFGPEGVFARLEGSGDAALAGGRDAPHLGHQPNEPKKRSNSRNGHSTKTITTETGPVRVRVPRDREGTSSPS